MFRLAGRGILAGAIATGSGFGAFALKSRGRIHLDAPPEPSSGNVYIPSTVHSRPGSKLSIYPESDPEVILVETHSDLEHQIGLTREHVTHFYNVSRSQVHDIVSKWIGVEEAVESRIKSLLSKDEPLTPGVLYIGVATLTGSIIGRTRSLPVRILLPPTFLILAFPQFLPKTSANLRAYFASLEDHYLPDIATQHDTFNRSVAKLLADTCKKYAELTKSGKDGILAGLQELEKASGLKLGTKTQSK